MYLIVFIKPIFNQMGPSQCHVLPPTLENIFRIYKFPEMFQKICKKKYKCFKILGYDKVSANTASSVPNNRTDHRMHVEGIQICQINRWNNCFLNMYGMNRQQLTVWPGKSILCKEIIRGDNLAKLSQNDIRPHDFLDYWPKLQKLNT